MRCEHVLACALMPRCSVTSQSASRRPQRCVRPAPPMPVPAAKSAGRGTLSSAMQGSTTPEKQRPLGFYAPKHAAQGGAHRSRRSDSAMSSGSMRCTGPPPAYSALMMATRAPRPGRSAHSLSSRAPGSAQPAGSACGSQGYQVLQSTVGTTTVVVRGCVVSHAALGGLLWRRAT
jgi:hypothetical protein